MHANKEVHDNRCTGNIPTLTGSEPTRELGGIVSKQEGDGGFECGTEVGMSGYVGGKVSECGI